MEKGKGTSDYHQSLPSSVRKLRALNPLPPPRKCPRCQSNDTKFCYFNNYSINQPRYYCRTCERQWTHGGIQRDIPIGGKPHKGKRSSNKYENHNFQWVMPSVPQIQPFCPSINVSSLALIPPAIPTMMTPYVASSGFFPQVVVEAPTQPQQFQANNGYLNLVNPLMYNFGQRFISPTVAYTGSRIYNHLLDNNDGASSSIVEGLHFPGHFSPSA